ncbi:MAG: type III pantothenate kinase [Chloroflexi bacterium]|nr:type III pantothenate kinase [Chloroflexota bacterium]MCL5075549.1 type III pantothenate kinase [Chloroflexota bacterium]
MLLAIDIGNTNIVLGVYEGSELLAHWRIATEVHKLADEYAMLLGDLFAYAGLDMKAVNAVVVSSVVPPLTTTFHDLSQRYLGVGPLVVGPGIKTGVRIVSENPKEVGADRIVNALAAHRLYGGPAIIIDFGTATTFDAISRQGDYLGGAIAPGITISSESLFLHTAKLPRVELVRPKTAIGRNTVASMQSGIIFGYVGLVEGLIYRFRQELGECRVIATGGLAEIIAKETPLIQIVDPLLTLEGMRLIYEFNKESDDADQ